MELRVIINGEEGDRIQRQKQKDSITSNPLFGIAVASREIPLQSGKVKGDDGISVGMEIVKVSTENMKVRKKATNENRPERVS